MFKIKNGSGTKEEKEIKTFYPTVLEESEQVIDAIKNEAVIINLESLNKKNVQRFIDLLCGASYALNKGVCMLDDKNLLILDKE